jgi:polysaccharide pyruvyl transferase WcaK-like protein
VAVNLDPEDTVRTHGIESFPSSGYGPALHADGSRWAQVENPGPKWLARGLGSRRIFAAIQTLDMIVVSGGGQIEDFFGGAVSQPRILLTWTLLARLLGIPVAYFSVGVDQLSSRTSRTLSVAAVRLALLRSFRDEGSVDLLRKAGLGGECRIDPDPALGLDIGRLTRTTSRDSNLVVVSPISSRTWTIHRDRSYEEYLSSLVAACKHWARQGRHIRFLCSDTAMDPPIVQEVLARLDAGARERCEFRNVNTVQAFVEGVMSAQVVIASRLHGLILSVAARTPVIAVSPARKVTRFMLDSGLSEFCVDMATFTAGDLQDRFERVSREHSSLSGRLDALCTESRVRLEAGYDALVTLLPATLRLHQAS